MNEQREAREWPPVAESHGAAIAIAGSDAAAAAPPASGIALLHQAGRQAIDLLAATVIGAGVLVLFLLAVAWDPLDRRLGFRARRYERRFALRLPQTPPTAGS